MSRQRALVLTSTFLRHRHLINTAASRLDLVGVWQEQKSFTPEAAARTEEELGIIRAHFEERDAAECEAFADDVELRVPADCEVRTVAPGGTNSGAELARMQKLAPDVLLVFGTGILRQPFIQAFEGRALNLHLGLSPYYRGAGTNFWPLVNREPEYVGATIHFLDAGIDTGPIIAHVRPRMTADAGPHQIGNAAIKRGIAALVEAGSRGVGRLTAVPQRGEGRLYGRKDFGASAVRELHRQFASKMIEEYLVQREQRDRQLSLVSPSWGVA